MCERRGITFRPGQLDLHYTLSDNERMYLANYLDRWKRGGYELLYGPASQVPWLCFNLGDTGASHCTWSANSATIPTYRKGFRLYWWPSYSRWMTSRERLCTLGFPVLPCLAAASGMNLMTVDAETSKHLAGNAMHAACVGVAIALLLACTQLIEDPEPAKCLKKSCRPGRFCRLARPSSQGPTCLRILGSRRGFELARRHFRFGTLLPWLRNSALFNSNKSTLSQSHCSGKSEHLPIA